MSAGAILATGIAVIVLLAAVVLFTTARRRDTARATGYLSRETRKRDRSTPPALGEEQALSGREYELVATGARGAPGTEVVKAEPAALAPYVPPDPEVIGVTRRQFFNRSLVTLMGLGLSGFGAAVLAFLWPKLSGGFGSRINIGRIEDVYNNIDAGNGFFYVPEGRAWVTRYPVEAVAKAEAVYPGPVVEGMRNGVVALYQKCPHLGCRVPECTSSQWFECPCHGSQYNQAGEKKGGPAPRGMDRFGVSVSGGSVSIDTGLVFQGPPIGTNTTGQEAEGPHCIGAGGGGH